MTERDDENGAGRDDLMQRVALMETMMAEGRKATTRFGWIFVLWGAVDLIGIGWEYLHSRWWIWPVTLTSGFILQFIGFAVRRRDGYVCGSSMQSRSVASVWIMMGTAAMLYFGAAMISHFTWQISYLAGMQVIIGLAHAISAMILRWRAQGTIAALWWLGAVATFFVPPNARLEIFTAEMFFGFFCFGLYAMMLDRKNTPAAGLRHG